MIRAIRSIVALAACAACLRAQDVAAPKPAQPPEGFKALFNNKDLTGWHGWAIHSKGANPA